MILNYEDYKTMRTQFTGFFNQYIETQKKAKKDIDSYTFIYFDDSPLVMPVVIKDKEGNKYPKPLFFDFLMLSYLRGKNWKSMLDGLKEANKGRFYYYLSNKIKHYKNNQINNSNQLCFQWGFNLDNDKALTALLDFEKYLKNNQ